MNIQYKLLSTPEGVLQSPGAIFLDVDSEIELSFFMQGHKFDKLIVALVDKDGKEYRFSVVDKLTVPKRFLIPAVYKVFVFEIDGDRLGRRWECEPLILRRFDDLTALKLEASPDINFLAGQARACVEQYAELTEKVDALTAENERLQAEINAVISKQTAQTAFFERKLNEAIGAINILSEKIEQIEELEEK